MQYLVTGGAGFIGSHLAQALVERGGMVRIFDNFATGKESNLAALEGHVEVIRGDLRDLAAVRVAVEGVDVIFHQAALASPPLYCRSTHHAGKQHQRHTAYLV